MKGFALYSKNYSTRFLTLKEILNIRYIKNGFRIAYVFDITGFIYAFSRKLYLLGIILLILSLGIPLVNNLSFVSPLMENIILKGQLIFNIFLVIFAVEIEEFFLKRRGFKLVDFKNSRNLSEAIADKERSLSLKFPPKNKEAEE